MEYHAIILAAGQGKRMGAGKNKMFLNILDVPVVIHTLRAFEQDAACLGITLVINKAEQTVFKDLLEKFHVTKVQRIVNGGKERQDSVYSGLKAVSGEGIVLIHDGARPFIKKEQIADVVQSAASTGAAVLAVPVKDTIKKVESNKVIETVNRSSLWAVQTPQAFRLPLILQAHDYGRSINAEVTDDASLVELMGRDVAVVKGDYRNIKITTPEDLFFAEQYLRALKRGD
ncbi:2-C-methyl-D-erythritol 4-phosphate cytidylyltransferase [Scopulibacillus daqui]|uniref:2-C-methyl-D-erythritol 4-phosphate cytidylyltransferase n=1 Tax=Scopulibacillus daqui TaxID=1469162 RepID=A0ABS2Q3P9_9BACL|nr:2-C-methyl-D-erythritol 4-phosphate cytidylyltransferase [Scopulibacillus daqui]MBM7646746.1 2-C-methyl-D-erythritol 4-phosphate cytidylyltransferase [Scopulibacillus daqui]